MKKIHDDMVSRLPGKIRQKIVDGETPSEIYRWLSISPLTGAELVKVAAAAGFDLETARATVRDEDQRAAMALFGDKGDK